MLSDSCGVVSSLPSFHLFLFTQYSKFSPPSYTVKLEVANNTLINTAIKIHADM